MIDVFAVEWFGKGMNAWRFKYAGRQESCERRKDALKKGVSRLELQRWLVALGRCQ